MDPALIRARFGTRETHVRSSRQPDSPFSTQTPGRGVAAPALARAGLALEGDA